MKAMAYDCRSEQIGEVRIAVGGQNTYPGGPSGLLTIYMDDQPALEIQITKELAQLLLDTTRSWIDRE